ncbi:hypothetical protein [Nitratireductor alexandrii]|uniref:hypothetical protein n=1 Tax=Nitratireductor alexandrii TaxID=2448161 RepID=UPI000FD7B7C8|nr:hypothetical protein [Nitratireductor alexandrii]
MTPDIEKYRHFVDRFDLTEEEKAELIHTVWRVVEGFAYRAFRLDPVQQVVRPSVTEDASAKAPVLEFEKVPNTDNSLTDTFRLKARNRGRRKK